MMVNGVPKLTCAAFLRDYYPQPIRVEPLVNFPIIRDLVIDMSDFLDKLKSVKPWIIRKEEKPVTQGEYRQTPEELEEMAAFNPKSRREIEEEKAAEDFLNGGEPPPATPDAHAHHEQPK